MKPQYSELVERENKLATDIRIGEQKCKELYAKQGYSAQFKSGAERDSYLKVKVSAGSIGFDEMSLFRKRSTLLISNLVTMQTRKPKSGDLRLRIRRKPMRLERSRG